MTHPARGAPADPYRYGVYLRPDPHTCLAVTTITGQLRAQYGLVSAGAFPPHATLIGSQHITADPQRIIDALTPALAGCAPFPMYNNGVQRQGIGFVYNVHFHADGRTANSDLIGLARTVDQAAAPLVTPASSPQPGDVFDPATFQGHLSLASHDLYQRPDLHAELEDYLHGLPVTYPATFTAENVALYRTRSKDWTGRWWQTLSWEHMHTWRLQ